MEKHETSGTQVSPPKKPQSKIIIWIVRLYRQMCNDVYFLKGKGLSGLLLFVGAAIVILFIGVGIAAIVLPLSFILSLLLLLIGLKTLADYVVLAGYIVVLLSTYLFAILYFASENVIEYEKRPRYIHIDYYRGWRGVGEIAINGVRCITSDCIILDDRVYACHWAGHRKDGHPLSFKDLEPLSEANPSILVVGCGASGFIKVPEIIRQALQKEGIQLEVLDTDEAVERFNKLTQTGVNVAAALHLSF